MPFRTLILLLLSMSLFGCSMAPTIDTAITPEQQASTSLTVIEHDDSSLAWKKSSASLSKDYDKTIFINLPKTISFDTTDPRLANFDGDANKLRSHFRAQLEKQLTAAGYRVVDKPTHGALALQVSIADIERAPRDPNVTEYIPIGMLVGLSLHATGVRDETLYLFFQSEVSDSLTGVTLGRAVDRASGRNIGQDKGPVVEDIYPAMDTAARLIRERLDREFQPKGSV
ncbi:DUF3313 domain-containing protein [Pseudomonas auratipiscis]|uniref:DUF3313 domain-containing protein n=1 Tax=Pseudomonas auratipiscis TaxID=3115853 RepID=A0AB35WTV1_9PSED|nr:MULTISPECIES: DUF3313 domain-containing protein [unclassified Pseudomonas]MEE1865534.1 DUF3313 domain-containing protein [Pseudomonas sp. 120P]MEE1956480.1 DUF3313 domain-containing protein [Pseudomonas sp. 119P]